MNNTQENIPVVLPAYILRSMINHVLPVVAGEDEETRPAFKGVFISATDDRIDIMSSDTIRLVHCRYPVATPFDEFNVLVSYSTLQCVHIAIARLEGEEGDLEENIDSVAIQALGDKITFRGLYHESNDYFERNFELLKDVFPLAACRKLLDNAKDYTSQVVIKKYPLYDLFEHCTSDDEETFVKLIMNEDGVKIANKVQDTDTGTLSIVSSRGELVSMFINPAYVRDALDACETTEVTLSTVNHNKTLVVKCATETTIDTTILVKSMEIQRKD